MDRLAKLADLCAQLHCAVKYGEPMAKYVSFKIGGPADCMIEIQNPEALSPVLSYIKDAELPLFVLGNGSNLLVSDAGIAGVVLRMAIDAPPLLTPEGMMVCAASVSLKRICLFAQEQGLTGLEFAYGIPGSAGGAAFMNAGAYSGEMKDVLVKCEHRDSSGKAGVFTGSALKLAYRHSVYAERPYVITALHLQLKKGSPDAIQAKMQEFMQRRKEKQPLEYPSAGSVFKRPAGHFAGTLIEECGLKGRQIGGAKVSEKHAGFIINTGGATCGDVLQLIETIQQEVCRQTGIMLEPEIRRVGKS